MEDSIDHPPGVPVGHLVVGIAHEFADPFHDVSRRRREEVACSKLEGMGMSGLLIAWQPRAVWEPGLIQLFHTPMVSGHAPPMWLVKASRQLGGWPLTPCLRVLQQGSLRHEEPERRTTVLMKGLTVVDKQRMQQAQAAGTGWAKHASEP